jgi:hypothetical protein
MTLFPYTTLFRSWVPREIFGPNNEGNNRMPGKKTTLWGAALLVLLTTYYQCAGGARRLRWAGLVALCGRRVVSTEV